jgi:hypothetical protein
MTQNASIQSATKSVAELCKDRTDLENEENIIKGDLANARQCNHDTGPIYTALANVQAKLRDLNNKIDRADPVSKPFHPDFTQTQTILSTSSVRRKNDKARERNVNTKIQ